MKNQFKIVFWQICKLILAFLHTLLLFKFVFLPRLKTESTYYHLLNSSFFFSNNYFWTSISRGISFLFIFYHNLTCIFFYQLLHRKLLKKWIFFLWYLLLNQEPYNGSKHRLKFCLNIIQTTRKRKTLIKKERNKIADIQIFNKNMLEMDKPKILNQSSPLI